MLEKIFIVDDDETLREELRDFFDNYLVMEAASGEEALRTLRKANDIGLVILDVMMPGMNGIDVLTAIKNIDPTLATVILTGHSSKDTAVEALKARADDFIEKPIDIPAMKGTIERLLRARNQGNTVQLAGVKGKLEQVKAFVEKNCCRKTRLNDAADAVALSPKYLSRIFKEYMKIGFSEYRLNIQMGKAKEFLVKCGYNVNQVSEKLGYENSESFSRQFKKITRSTPTAYRRKMCRK